MLDTPCPEVGRRVLAAHSIRQFPLHFPSRASPCAITFQLESNCCQAVGLFAVRQSVYLLSGSRSICCQAVGLPAVRQSVYLLSGSRSTCCQAVGLFAVRQSVYLLSGSRSICCQAVGLPAVRQSVYFSTQSREKFLINRALLYWHFDVARTAVCAGSELKVVKFRTLKHLPIAAHRGKVIS
jgi:hypothetical protein